MSKPLILVTGATGYIGGRLVPRLRQAGYPVRCLARDPSRLMGRGWDDVDIRSGDVLKPETLPEVLEGVEVAYYLVHSMRAGEKGFERRDQDAARNFAQAAKQAGVKRVIYLGGLGQEDLSSHLSSRHETGEVLRREGPPVTEFRAAIIVGSGSISFDMLRYLTERVPIMICPRWVKTRCQPIAIRDVLRYLLDCLEEPASVGRIFEIGGRDVLTYRDMIREYARQRGLRRVLIPVPVLTPRLSSYWVDLVTPVPAALARPLIDGLKSEVICHDNSARELFPFEPRSYEEAIRDALQRSNDKTVETIWSTSLASLGKSDKPVQLSTEEGMIVERRQLVVPTSPELVYRIFTGIGGERGWFAYNWAWRLRGFLDRLVGGVGMRRGRRHPDEIYPGEALDFWRVETVEPNKLIRLRAEMKVPGRAWLQFEVHPDGEDEKQCRLIQTAFFEPRGLSGLLYWYVLYPIHLLIFRAMIRAIAKRAIKASREESAVSAEQPEESVASS